MSLDFSVLRAEKSGKNNTISS